MKNKFLTLLAATAMLIGCSDAYEVDQPGYVTEESTIFSNADDIAKGIQGLYSSLPGESEVFFDSFFTDELGIGRNNSGQGVNDGSYTFILQAGNDFADNIWSNYYNVVNRTNRMLARIDVLMETADNAEKVKLNANKAKLHAMRAYCHYKLFAFFTPDYSNPSGLSVIKFDFLQTDDYSRFEKRATVGEIVAFIEEDINTARNLGVEGMDSSYVTENLLDAILVKMYSMIGTADAYTKLEQAFTRLTTNDVNPKGMIDSSQFLEFFTAYPSYDTAESIFRLKRTKNYGSTTSGVASQWYAAKVNLDDDNVIYMEMGRSLYNELDKLDPTKTGQPLKYPQGTVDPNDSSNNLSGQPIERNDVRYGMYVFPDSKVEVNYQNLSQEDYQAKDLILVGKYTGIENRPLMNDIQVFRFTDMLLALAEKRAFEGALDGNVAVGDYSNVKSIIYNVRVSRNTEGEAAVAMPTDFSSTQAAYARILEERRVEFAFEGMRYLDMKRLGVKAGSPGFVRDAKDCASTGACQLAPNTFKSTLPIPRAEILANPNIVQNPGY